jgi:hypothetical protein
LSEIAINYEGIVTETVLASMLTPVGVAIHYSSNNTKKINPIFFTVIYTREIASPPID